ncbi:MAG: TDT family transporter [Spirochaetota bacterium]|nr:TDT family transporter [Spirochaetota bacterium]
MIRLILKKTRRIILKQKLKRYPVALTGIALGISGLGGALATIFGNGILYLCVMIAACLLTIILIKNLLYPQILLEELRHPTASGVVPTFDMALMIIASVVVNINPLLGKILWWIAIILHAICLGFFLKNRIQNFTWDHIIPSWFVPPIGIVTASVTGSQMGFPLVSQSIFYIGFTFYLVMLPMMFYRVIFVNPIEEARLPSFGIMAAPPSLCLAGYLTAFPDPNILIIAVLVGLALCSTSLVYMSMFRIWKIKFSPMYASYTFPLAIGSTAMIKTADYFNTVNHEFYTIFRIISYVELTIAVIVIIYIFIKLHIWVYHNIHKNSE